MEERIITLETARLAKGKGFNWPTDARYFYDEAEQRKWVFSKMGITPCRNTNEDSICAPTQSLLQKWLREVHNIDIEIHTYSDDNNSIYDYLIYQSSIKEEVDWEDGPWPIYEDALEAALHRALTNM